MNEPIRDLLEPVFDSDDVERVHRRLKCSLRAPVRRRHSGLMFVAAVALLGVVSVGAWELTPGVPAAEAPTAPPGPLLDVDRSQVFESAAAATQHREVRFDDDSTIALSPGTSIDALSNSGDELTLVMSSGTATFDVAPGGPRRWSIDASWLTVDVLGTRFSIERTASFVEVRVSRGLVRVHGARVPGGVRRLSAGASIRVQAPVVQAPAMQVVEPAEVPEILQVHEVREVRETRWRANVASGAYDQAFEQLERRGFAREVTAAQDAETLLLIADAARLSGHPRQAVEPLERLIRTYPRDRRAGLAAFTLGRIEHESLRRPAAAIAAFEHALELGLPLSLERPARLRIEQARAQLPD